MPMSTENTYITVADVAKIVHASEKFVRQYFIGRKKVRYIKFDRRYLIERESFNQWEQMNLKRVVSRH